MPLINRLSRLFQADLHAVLDRVEEPELLLKQSLREMEAELDGASRRLRARELELAEALRLERDLDEALERIAEELDLCFDSGKEELARKLVRRRLETERARKAATDRRERIDSELAEAKERQAEQSRQLEALRQKAELFEETGCRDRAPTTRFTDEVTDDDVEVAFLREQQRRAAS